MTRARAWLMLRSGCLDSGLAALLGSEARACLADAELADCHRLSLSLSGCAELAPRAGGLASADRNLHLGPVDSKLSEGRMWVAAQAVARNLDSTYTVREHCALTQPANAVRGLCTPTSSIRRSGSCTLRCSV